MLRLLATFNAICLRKIKTLCRLTPFEFPSGRIGSVDNVGQTADNKLVCEQALCLGEKSKEREGKGLFHLPSSPLDQRPVHRLITSTQAA